MRGASSLNLKNHNVPTKVFYIPGPLFKFRFDEQKTSPSHDESMNVGFYTLLLSLSLWGLGKLLYTLYPHSHKTFNKMVKFWKGDGRRDIIL